LKDAPLNLHHLAEIAALVSAHAAHLIEQPGKMPARPLQNFWKHSRHRLHGWTFRLRSEMGKFDSLEPELQESAWGRTEPILEQIFVSDLLTRVWAAVLTASDRRRQVPFAEPIARNVLVGHLEARHLALGMMVNCPQGQLRRVQRIDRLRRSMERWTDLLLGHLVCRYDVGEFAFEVQRAVDFGNDQIEGGLLQPGTPAWRLLIAGLTLAIPKTHPTGPIRSREHDRVVQSIIGAFPADAFAADGSLRSLMCVRIGRGGVQPEGSSPPMLPSSKPSATEQGESVPEPSSQSAQPEARPRKGVCFRDIRRRRNSEQ
jgi:hypothetical protein